MDGSSTTSMSGASIILTSLDGMMVEYALWFTFPASNNEAEYEALITGLTLAKELGAKELKAFSDSQLIVGQANGEFEARSPSMIEYLKKVKEIMAQFQTCKVQQIPRSENARADILAKLATSQITDLGGNVHLETLKNRSIDKDGEVLCITTEPNWMDPIIKYLKNGELPDDPAIARKVKRQAPHYVLVEEKSYKRSHYSPLLKCLSPSEVDYALREVHEGIYGNHLGGRALSYKILRQGYYWPTMQEEAIQYAKRYDACQCHTSVQRQPATELIPLRSPWSFAQ